MTTTPHAANLSGRPLNPDTEAPMPTPTTRQLALVDELCTKLGRANDPADTVRLALVEAVVREHGRTLRGCIAELRSQADSFDRDAKVGVGNAHAAHLDGGPIDLRQLATAQQLATSAAALRTAMLRGDR